MQEGQNSKSNHKPATVDELKAELENYKQLYNHAPDMFVSVNFSTGRIDTLNDTLLKTLGYQRKELIGQPVEILYPKEHAQSTRSPLSKEVSFTNKEFELLTKSGETIPVLISSRAIHDEQGNVVRSNSSCREISSLEQKQNEILATNRNLEDQVQERTRQLMKRNKEMEQFAFVASHDLQEPLLTITNFSKRLLNQYHGQFDEPGQKSLEFIVDATHRMQNLVEALLSYGLIGQKQQVEKVNLKQTLKEVLHNLHAQTEASDAKVTLGYLPVIYGLGLELRQLFENLISNCLKFRQNDKSCEIKIWAEEEDDYYHFRVRDNGIGIAEEHQQKIFEIFKRLHHNKTIAGTGIGLALCAKIVDMHGGEMWVNSEPDNGSVFHFTMKKHPGNHIAH